MLEAGQNEGFSPPQSKQQFNDSHDQNSQRLPIV
jgi:hypothetical protein